MKISAYVMAKNEERCIEKCLSSLSWCDEIILGDTGSTDKTIQIAKSLGAKVLQTSFEGFGATRNKIVNTIEADWIVCFDADEVCTEELKQEILSNIFENNSSALIAPRKNFLVGQEVKHSGWCPDFRHPVAFRKSDCKYEEKILHETLEVKGQTKRLKSSFEHHSYPTLKSYMDKINKYSVLGAEELIRKKKKIKMASAASHSFFKFIRHYFINLGFLDGWTGLTIAIASAYGTFFKYSIAYEKQKKSEKMLTS